MIRWTFVSHKFDHSGLISSILSHVSSLSDPKSVSELTIGNYTTKWLINEDLGLIYVLAHPKIFPIEWTGSFLKRIDNLITKDFAESIKNDQFYEFDDLEFLEKFTDSIKREEAKSKEYSSSSSSKPKLNFKKSMPNKLSSSNNENQRCWNDKLNKSDLASLDYSDKTKTKVTCESSNILNFNEKSKVDELSDFESSHEEEEENKTLKNSWWNSLKSLTGNSPIRIEDLEPALKEMKLHLIEKNVASETAEFVVKSVGNRLIGRIPGTFSLISRMVRDATRETLQTILTPTKPNDLLNEINKRKGRPFVMAFIGVNGVGKSTNLSKVAFWLLQHGLKVLLVAGDTFRAGAIEQLRHHCRNLGNIAPNRIEIYERGYGKDAALIAQDAIKYAKEKSFDLVLIDTAGRMQDNGPLMIALAKLITLNTPDRVIFVGEALVGHDALSQLQKFNSALLDHSAKPIDGILLTKVDTIDDKIGAALSMTLTAKAPILFMGVGQTYTDLKRINIKQIVDLLLK